MIFCHSQIEAVGNLTQPDTMLALSEAEICHDPHSFSCCFFTPPFCSAVFGVWRMSLRALLGLFFLFLLPPSLFFDFPPQRSPVLFRRKRRILRIRGLLLAVALATAGHNRLTRPQRGRSGAFQVSLPYLAPKTAHRLSQGQVWFSSSFPGALLLR